jgi:UDP-glucuronate 4-epimerase
MSTSTTSPTRSPAALEADRIPGFAYNAGGGVALTMPNIVAIAETTIPRARVRMIPGEDDVLDVQTAFDLSRARADLGWAPTRDLAQGLRAHAAAIHAGRAA